MLKTCDIVTELPEAIARRAGQLRFRAKRGSAVGVVVVATAEPGGSVLTGDGEDPRALANLPARLGIETPRLPIRARGERLRGCRR